MAMLASRPDLDQLHRQAIELHRAASAGDPEAVAQIGAASDRPSLASAQLVLAREYGFATWARLETEVERRVVFNAGDLPRLQAILATQPELATIRMEHWCDHKGADPLGYLAMLRFDARRLGLSPDMPHVGAMARALLEAGAPVEGTPDASAETPLMTAASYGDAEVASILIQAGADLEARASPTAGGVPNGTALRHAAVFAMTPVVDVLVAAGATIHDLAEAAAAGSMAGWLTPETPMAERVYALRLAAGNGRLAVIDELLAAGTPVDGVDDDGSTALHEAAFYANAASVRHLLSKGADPSHKDTTYDGTPLDWCRHQHEQVGDSPAHEEVEAILGSTAPVRKK